MSFVCSDNNCHIEDSYEILLKEIYSNLSTESVIDICCSKFKGKHIHSKVNIPKDTNFLQEVPFVSWPIKSSFKSLNETVFCENCLKIKNSDNSNEFLSLPEAGFDKNICGSFCFKKISGINFESQKYDENLLKNGWSFYLQGSRGLSILRDYQSSVDPSGEIPITAEAISRCISQLAADIHFYWSELGRKPENLCLAFKLGCKTMENFIAPPLTLFPEINLHSLTNIIRTVLEQPIKNAFSNDEIVNALLSKDTIEQILGQLVLNSQELNIWGSNNSDLKSKSLEDNFDNSESWIQMIKGACICVIQSCFNHSCDPNCYVHSIDDTTVYLIAKRDIKSGEELTISYIDNSLPLQQRRFLIQNYHFECFCSACKKEERNFEVNNYKKLLI